MNRDDIAQMMQDAAGAEVKVCTRCRTMKPLTDYRENGRGGLRAGCRDCGNKERAAYKAKQPAQQGKRTLAQIRQDKRNYHRQRAAVKRLLSGKFKGDGPCWVCRNQAVGDTPYRLCIVCLG